MAIVILNVSLSNKLKKRPYEKAKAVFILVTLCFSMCKKTYKILGPYCAKITLFAAINKRRRRRGSKKVYNLFFYVDSARTFLYRFQRFYNYHLCALFSKYASVSTPMLICYKVLENSYTNFLHTLKPIVQNTARKFKDFFTKSVLN